MGAEVPHFVVVERVVRQVVMVSAVTHNEAMETAMRQNLGCRAVRAFDSLREIPNNLDDA